MLGDYTRRMARLGQHVTDFAKRAGWDEGSGEGAFEFIQRKSYQQGWEDGKQEGSGDVHRDGVGVVPSTPVAWGLFAYIDGEGWVLQFPVRATQRLAEGDKAMYASGTKLQVLPLTAGVKEVGRG